MGLQPKIEKKKSILKTCPKCGNMFGAEGFAYSKNWLFDDELLPVCNDCVDKYLYEDEADLNSEAKWARVDKMCQWADIPFVPKEWENIREMNPIGAFARYAEIFKASEYNGLGWDDYYKAFVALKEKGTIEDELPLISENKMEALKKKWGQNYDSEELEYLENLYSGLLKTQNVNGNLQIDQALKICRISLEIDSRIRAGEEFDKLLNSYDKLVKTAEFTPKNVKNINDFDTLGELIKWLEKRGWQNPYYDNVTQDVVDETIKNIQNFNQRLYTNETGIGEDISHRIEQLRMAKDSLEDIGSDHYYTENKQYDLDNYDNSGFEELLKSQEFSPDGEND